MIDPIVLQFMHEEMRKEAFNPALLGNMARGAVSSARNQINSPATQSAIQAAGRHIARSATNTGAGMGLGAAAGGLIGGARGAYNAYNKPEEEGGGNLLGAGLGALSGAGRGAAIGTALGGAAGLASGGRGTKMVNKLTQGLHNPLGMAARQGQQKLHSITGLVPGGAARGTAEYAKGLHQANIGGVQTLAAKSEAALTKAKMLAEQREHILSKAQAGQSSLAGLANTIRQKGAREGGKEILQHGLGNISAKGALTAAALPVGAAALTAMQPDDPDNPQKGKRVGNALGSALASTATPFVGSTGGELVGRAGGAVGGTIGQGIHHVIGAVKPKPQMYLGGGASTPGAQPGLDSPQVERVMSNAAQGKPPDNLMT
jgi:hypothetical protein